MSGPSCPKCGDTSIIIAETIPANCTVPVALVRCATCGETMGMMETADFSNIFRRIKKTIDPHASTPASGGGQNM